MPCGNRLFPDLGLLYVRFWGRVTIAEIEADFLSSAANPDYDPGMRHLFDFSGITSLENDPVAFMAFQARMLDSFGEARQAPVIAFWVPNEIGRNMLQLARKSWSDGNNMTLLGAETEKAALELLGLDWPAMPALDDAAR